MSIAEKEITISNNNVTIAENAPKVYEAGRQAGQEAGLREMWEAIQCGGTRTNYGYGFLEYTNYSKKTFKPIYDIKPIDAQSYQWTRQCPIDKQVLVDEGQVDMKELEAEQGISFDFSGCTNFTATFAGGLFSTLNVIDISNATTTVYAFYGGYLSTFALRLKRIERLICSKTTPFATSTFQYATKLEYIGFEGVIGTNGLNLSWSTLLGKESLVSLINVVEADTSLTITLSKTSVDNAFETSEGAADGSSSTEWAELIATKPNCTVSLI